MGNDLSRLSFFALFVVKKKIRVGTAKNSKSSKRRCRDHHEAQPDCGTKHQSSGRNLAKENEKDAQEQIASECTGHILQLFPGDLSSSHNLLINPFQPSMACGRGRELVGTVSPSTMSNPPLPMYGVPASAGGAVARLSGHKIEERLPSIWSSHSRDLLSHIESLRRLKPGLHTQRAPIDERLLRDLVVLWLGN